METRENKFVVQRNCANTGKISPSVSFYQYFQVFHTKFNNCFSCLVLLEMILSRKYILQSYMKSGSATSSYGYYSRTEVYDLM